MEFGAGKGGEHSKGKMEAGRCCHRHVISVAIWAYRSLTELACLGTPGSPRHTGLVKAHQARQPCRVFWNIVRTRLEYFGNRASTSGKSTAEIETELKNILVKQLGSISKIDFDTAASISVMLKEATFLSDPTKAMIGDLIHSKLGNSMPLECEASSGPKMKFRAVENY